jgi:oligoribonuclease (3'-5' exoribonuclease)
VKFNGDCINSTNIVSYCTTILFQMTMLDVTAGRILEVACLVTDSDLNIIAEGPDVVIHQPDDILQSMSEWCIKHHGMVKWLFLNLI